MGENMPVWPQIGHSRAVRPQASAVTWSMERRARRSIFSTISSGERRGRASSGALALTTATPSSVDPRLGLDLRRVDAALVMRGQRVRDNGAIVDAHLAVDAGEGVLSPVLVVAVRVVLARMGAAALVPGLGRVHGRQRAGQQVREFQRLH